MSDKTIKEALQKVEMILIIKCRSDSSPLKTWRKSLSNWFGVEAHGKRDKKNLRGGGGGGAAKKGCLSFDTRLLIKTKSVLCKSIFIDP